MSQERIQKVMAQCGLCSRRAAEKIINENRVKLNGRPVKLGDKMDTAKDLLTVDNEKVFVPKKQEKLYYMVNKPRGYITSVNDELGRKTVMSLVSDIPDRLYPVGRLDRNSEGLLFMTNDGEFTNLLTHPRHEIAKLYRLTVHPNATEDQLAQLSAGVVLDDGSKTLPASVHVVSDSPERMVIEIGIKEGKNRQIRRMCEAVGLEVARLKRVSVGAVKLGMLQPGKYRALSKTEVTALKSAANKATRNPRNKEQ